MHSSTWKAAILLLAAFALGAGAGSALAMRAGHHSAWGGNPKERTDEYVGLLDRSLRLTGPQRDSIRAILVRHQPEMDSIWQDVRPRFETLRTEIRSEVRVQLDAEQQRKYADLMARMDEERHKAMSPSSQNR
jgi:Spy/CpxP family protein refolding chaperone